MLNQSVDMMLYVFVGVILILYCGLRNIGDDQDSAAYATYYFMDDYRRSLVAEPTFSWIAQFSEIFQFSNGLTIVFMVYAIIGVTIKFVAIRLLSDLRWLAIITYMGSYFLLHEFTQIRASIASGLLLLSIKFIFDRRLWLYLSCIGTASLFHYSALIAVPLYFLGNSQLTMKSKLAIASAVPTGIVFYVVGFEFLYIIPIEIVRQKIDVYLQVESLRELKLNVYNLVYIAKYSVIYIFLIFADKISLNNKYFPILIKIYALAMFSYLAFAFNAVFAMRISELLGVVEIFLIPLLIYVSKGRMIGLIGVLIFAVVNLSLGIYEAELINSESSLIF